MTHRGTIKGQTTKTKAGIPSDAVRWWRNYGHLILACSKDSAFTHAAAKGYQEEFKRDFWHDLKTVEKYESLLKEKVLK